MIIEIPSARAASTYAADWVHDRRVILAVQPAPGDNQLSVDVWDLPVAEKILADKCRLAAEYERDAVTAENDGRVTDQKIHRDMAELLLTQARDLAQAVLRAGGRVDVRTSLSRAA